MTDDRIQEPHLEGMSALFLAAMTARQRGQLDRATELLRALLRREPRLPEPRLELAHIYLGTDRLSEAEIEAREALRLLEAGGQWVEDLSEEIMASLAHNTLAEVLRRAADTDEVIFGDPERFKAILAESRHHFARAAALDPDNEHAGHHDFFLNLDDLPEEEGR